MSQELFSVENITNALMEIQTLDADKKQALIDTWNKLKPNEAETQCAQDAMVAFRASHEEHNVWLQAQCRLIERQFQQALADMRESLLDTFRNREAADTLMNEHLIQVSAATQQANAEFERRMQIASDLLVDAHKANLRAMLARVEQIQ